MRGHVITVRWVTVLLLLGIALGTAAGPPPAAEALARFRGIYDDGIAKIQKGAAVADPAVIAGYKTRLTAAGQVYQEAGDLNGLLAVRKELERFAQSPTLAQDDVVEAPEGLQALQTQFLPHFSSDRSASTSHAIIDFSRKYVARLKALQQEYSQSGRIDDALAMNTELKRVLGSELIAAAKADVAANPVVAPAPDLPPVVAIGDDGPEPVEAPDGVEIYGDCTIYWTERPGDIEGARLRTLATRPTPAGRLRRGIVVRPMSGDSDVSVMPDGATMDTHFRFAVRATTAEEGMERLRLVAHVCSLRWDDDRDRMVPYVMDSYTVPLKKVGRTDVYVDLPPVVSRIHGRRTAAKSRVHGLVVSVYGAEGNILYQAVSKAELARFAQDRVRSLVDLEKKLGVLEKEFERAEEEYDQANDAFDDDPENEDLRRRRDWLEGKFDEARREYKHARRAFEGAGGQLE